MRPITYNDSGNRSTQTTTNKQEATIMQQEATRDPVVLNIEHRNRIECYKALTIDLIESGMFFSARDTLTKCIKEARDYTRTNTESNNHQDSGK